MDYPTDNAWTGLEVAVHPTHTSGYAFIGKFDMTYGFKDATPIAFLEGGPSIIIPEDEAIVRVAILTRLGMLSAPYPLAIRPGGTPQVGGRQQFGVVPGVMASLEFEWGDVAPYTVGFKGGVGSSAVDGGCADGVDPAYCITWAPAFIGGFYGRFRMKNGLAAELIVGPTASLSIGWGRRFSGNSR
jgi:hypothetical protein